MTSNSAKFVIMAVNLIHPPGAKPPQELTGVVSVYGNTLPLLGVWGQNPEEGHILMTINPDGQAF